MKLFAFAIAGPCLAAAQIWGGAEDHSSEDLDGYFDKANLTGRLSFPFYDFSKNYSKNAKDDVDWEILMKVTNELPKKNEQGKYTVGVQISWAPPNDTVGNDGELNVVEDEWRTCDRWIIAKKMKRSTEIHSQCEGMLSEKCLRGLKGQVESLPCGLISLPKECVDENDGWRGNSYSAGREVASNSTWTVRFGLNGGDPHEAGDSGPYNDAMRMMFVMVMGAGKYTNDSGSGGIEKHMEFDSQLPGALVCIGSTESPEGSKQLSDTQRMSVPVLGSLFAVLAVVSVI